MNIEDFLKNVIEETERTKIKVKDFVFIFKEMTSRDALKKIITNKDNNSEDAMVNIIFDSIVGWENVKYKDLLNEEQLNNIKEKQLFDDEQLNAYVSFDQSKLDLLLKNNNLLIDVVNSILERNTKKKN